MLRFSTLACIALAVSTAACGGNAAPVTDAGTDGGIGVPDASRDGDAALVLPSGAVLAAPIPPAAPAPAAIEPCRAGWRPITSTDAPTTCDPWPLTGRATCALGEAHFAGEPACRVIGSACPSGDWPDGLAAAGVLYVRADAPTGGTGERAAPFTSIGAALAVATPGTLVMVARGSYDEAVTLPTGVSLRGACVEGTRIAHATRDSAPATLRIAGTDVAVSDVQVGGARAGILVDTDAGASIMGVLVDRATETGIRVHRRGQATLRDVVLARTQTDPDDHISAFGMMVELGGVVTAAKLVVDETGGAGILVDNPGSRLTLDDAAIMDTSADASGAYGLGVAAQGSGAITLHGVIIDGASFSGLIAAASGRIDAADIVVRRVTPDARGQDGSAVEAQTMGEIHLRRALVELAPRGFFVAAGSVGGLEDVLLRNFTGLPSSTDGRDGQAILLSGGTLTGARVWITNAGYTGLFVNRAGNARVSDFTVTDLAGGNAGDLGSAVDAEEGSDVEVTRGLFARARTVAANAALDGTRLHLTDVTIRDTQARASDGKAGRGVQSQLGALLELERVRIEGCREIGAMVLVRGMLTGEDLDIRDMRGGTGGIYDGFGMGLALQDQAVVTLSRVHIARSLGWGVKVDVPASTLTVEDLWVSDVDRWSRGPIDGTTAGRGIDVSTGTVSIRRAIVEGAHESGVFVGGGSTIEVADIIVRDTLGEAVTGIGGNGFDLVGGASVTATDISIEHIRDTAIFAVEGARFEGTRARIVMPLQRACAGTTCAAHAAGVGPCAGPGGVIELFDFTVIGAALCGVQVAGGDMDLHRGRVEGSPIGANVQTVGYDIARLQDMVVYEGNERNLDSTNLPVPAAVSPIPVMDGP